MQHGENDEAFGVRWSEGKLERLHLCIGTSSTYSRQTIATVRELHSARQSIAANVSGSTEEILPSASLAPFPPLRDLQYWDKALIAFEELGVIVGFMRARIAKLVKISRAFENVNGSWSAKWAAAEETDRDLKEKVLTMDALLESIETLKASKTSAEEEMDAFEEEVGDLDSELSLVAAPPWS